MKGILVTVFVIILDQATKFYLLNILSPVADSRMMILPFFNLVLVWNNGISFGMFHGFQYASQLFSLTAILIVALLMMWLYKAHESSASLALGLVIGGAMGNISDRLRFGSVVDFLDFHWGVYHWPAFNIADSAVCIGAVILVIHGMLEKKQAI